MKYYDRRKTSNYNYCGGCRRARWYVPTHSQRKLLKCEEIAKGDLIAVCRKGSGPLQMTAGVAYPFSMFANSTLSSISDYFLGVAADESVDGDSGKIVVDTTGKFEFSCPSTRLTVGMYASPVTGNASLESQRIKLSQTSSADCIALCVEHDGYTTNAKVFIKSRVARLWTDINDT